MCEKEFGTENTERESTKPGNAIAEMIQKPDANLTLDRHLLIFQAYEQMHVCPCMLIVGSNHSFLAGPIITNCILICDSNDANLHF